jgi:tetratricopeptide (TPR) repeat protein
VKQAYSFPEVAVLLGVEEPAARQLAELVHGEVREQYSFQDLVLLRSARALKARKVSRGRIAQALARLRAATTPGEPMSGVALAQEGKELVLGTASGRFNAESGQELFDFGRPATATWLRPQVSRDAEALFARAAELEATDPDAAADTYTAALAANPQHADAHLNVGRLLHQRGRLKEAEAHYVAALVCRPDDATATFNLAVVLEDLGRVPAAIARYHEAIALDPDCGDAYFNLARLYEKKGEHVSALRHLKDYRRLSEP